MDNPIQRSGLPLLIVSALIFAAASAVVLLVVDPFDSGFFAAPRPGPAAQPEPAAPAPDARPEPEARPAPEARPEPAPRPAPEPAAESAAESAREPATHTVVRGDTLFDLAGRYWSDPYLWPLILAANESTVRDPDFLRQGSRLEIPASPLRGGVLPAEAAAAVDRAHILAYERYRSLGEESLAAGRAGGDLWAIQRGLIRINKSHWVLYSGLRYDENLLDVAEGRVAAADVAIVRSFISRFGPRPGSR